MIPSWFVHMKWEGERNGSGQKVFRCGLLLACIPVMVTLQWYAMGETALVRPPQKKKTIGHEASHSQQPFSVSQAHYLQGIHIHQSKAYCTYYLHTHTRARTQVVREVNVVLCRRNVWQCVCRRWSQYIEALLPRPVRPSGWTNS